MANVANLRNAARRIGIPVFYSQQTPFDLKQDTDVWIRIRMRRAGVTDPSKVPEDVLEGSKAWEITDDLKPLQGEIVFKKRRPSAFIGTDFDLTLRSMRVETVILAGVTTESGIEGSARHGLNLGYYMVVVKDCTGSVIENRHTTALKSMETFFDLVDSKEIISLWDKTSDAG
jgi:ureidoacrylate peracid hydrolase